MRIAVIGAGIGGLAVAAGLGADGNEVVVFERRESSDAHGAGLTLFDNAFAALDALGLGDAVRLVSADAIAGRRFGQRTPDGDWLLSLPVDTAPNVRSLHRSDLQRTLLDSLPPNTVRLSRRASVSTDGAPIVTVDGVEARFDLVVAADGLRSDARRHLGLDRGVRFAGVTAWRGVTHAGVELHGSAGETWGRGRTFGIVPLSDGRVYWFATDATVASQSQSQSETHEREEVRMRFGDWHPPILACIDATPPETVLRHDIYDLARLPRAFVRGRVALLGDAAHGMTPHLGQGAGQAIEDAATLSILLRSGSIDAALARYDELRRKRTRAIWRQSRFLGRVAQLASPGGASIRDALLRATPPAVAMSATRSARHWSPDRIGHE